MLPVVAAVAREQAEQRVVRRRVGRDGQRLGGLQGETVEVFQGADDGGTGAGARRELGDVAGHGAEEVGTGTQQPGQ